eukprot:1161882-Pelagomonas_calceolata.AAC.10
MLPVCSASLLHCDSSSLTGAAFALLHQMCTEHQIRSSTSHDVESHGENCLMGKGAGQTGSADRPCAPSLVKAIFILILACTNKQGWCSQCRPRMTSARKIERRKGNMTKAVYNPDISENERAHWPEAP